MAATSGRIGALSTEGPCVYLFWWGIWSVYLSGLEAAGAILIRVASDVLGLTDIQGLA